MFFFFYKQNLLIELLSFYKINVLYEIHYAYVQCSIGTHKK